MGLFDFLKGKPAAKPDITAAINDAVLNCSSSTNTPKSETPAPSELSDSDVILLEYCTYGSYPNPKNGYPGMWEREFHLTDTGVDCALQSLEKRGYIRFCSALEMLPKFTIAQLKDIAGKNNVTVKGKKADILAAVSSVPIDELERTVKQRKYCLTEKGEVALRANEHIVYAFQNSAMGISVKRMKELVRDNPNRPYQDLVWAELNRKSECFSGFPAYRNIRYSMYANLMQEKRYESALGHLYEIFFLDLNEPVPSIAPGIVKKAREIVSLLNYSKDDFFIRAQKRMEHLPVEVENFSWLDTAGIFTALVFKMYEDACSILIRCPDRCSKDDSFRVRNLETGEWEIVSGLSTADYLIRQVLSIDL